MVADPIQLRAVNPARVCRLASLTHRTLRGRPHCPLPQKEITEVWPPNADLRAGSDEGCEVGECRPVVAKGEHRWFVVT